jgi:hypothetical protein
VEVPPSSAIGAGAAATGDVVKARFADDAAKELNAAIDRACR